MDDLLKPLAIGFGALLVFHWSLGERAHRDTTHAAESAFHHTGVIRTVIRPNGMFGYFTNSLADIDIYGEHQSAGHLPFLLYPKGGWKGSVRHLRLHFTDLTLNGIPIERLDGDLPFVTYDPTIATLHDRIILRGAGFGPLTLTLGERGMETFLQRKFQKILSDVRVEFDPPKIILKARLRFLGKESNLVAIGRLAPSEQRYLIITDPELTSDGLPMTPLSAASLMRIINPVVDSIADVGLSDVFTITSVEIGEDAVIVHGQTSIPTAF